ncbi:ER membrane protein complex subunit 3 [Gracilariopsis chorda]|uniref:ER membrane protein complex subunit 3 n=1 Tax=Gracilariopsis chorda TaxID=448386 RepID=A0A2V3J3P1_9FLOR|nr:ER membrane protein complex subunit 3 [Gracilariopsis chorda]|eukprot:PXF49028.1 ER membrane protein complex subunit 3 [Gracilariopsis chorda]
MDNTGETLDIHLDRSLQLWVLLPITIVTILMNLLKRNLLKLIVREPPTTLHKTRDANLLNRAQTFRKNCFAVSKIQFEARRYYFSQGKGPLYKPPVRASAMSPLMNPDSLANQVLSVVINIIPQMLLGVWARYTFAGVVVCRLPFTLTPRFRPMLQSGLDIASQSLDLRYVSSLSWYVLNLFGNAGLLSLVSTGSDYEDILVPNALSQISMNVAADKVFAQERAAIQKSTHSCRLDDFEQRVLLMPLDQFGKY